MKRALVAIVIQSILSICLFIDSSAVKKVLFIETWIAAIASLLKEPSIQWVVFLCVALYALVFTIVDRRVAPNLFLKARHRDLWLSAMIAIIAIHYIIEYPVLESTKLIIVILGIFVGKLLNKLAQMSYDEVLVDLIVFTLPFLGILGFAFNNSLLEFMYHGTKRWTGVFENPNTFGMAMGSGVALAFSTIAQRYVSSRNRNGTLAPLHSLNRTSFSMHCVSGLLMLCGLVKSYSRGAWIGTGAALIYAGASLLPSLNLTDSTLCKIKSSKALIVTLAAAGIILAVISVMKEPLFERALSIANRNDFSWRNRLVAYEAALTMIGDKPLTGFGWTSLNSLCAEYYKMPKTTESLAIETNDYLTLCGSLGIPFLFLFLLVIVNSFWSTVSLGGYQNDPSPHEPKVPYRAGVIVLLVGFFFDGGIFTLAMGITFWILLECGV